MTIGMRGSAQDLKIGINVKETMSKQIVEELVNPAETMIRVLC